MTETRTEQAGTSDPGAKLEARRVRLERFDMEIGPLGHLAAERERLSKPVFNHFEVIPRGTTVGAELVGIDLRQELADEVIVDMGRALRDYKMIFFRDQPITSAQHVAFARRFGDLEIHPFITGSAEHPELDRFEKSADVGGFENAWHHDVTWRERPSMGAVLHAIRVPATGGDTLFSDMGAAYDGLDQETRDLADGKFAIHDFMLAFGQHVPSDQQEAARTKYPLARHPVIHTHPVTGRKVVYVNRLFTSHIEGLTDAESHDLIFRLARRAEILAYQYRLTWEPHTVAFWDNRAVQHYATSDYWPDVRIMERASIVGPRPE